jgi:hypothetical protein
MCFGGGGHRSFLGNSNICATNAGGRADFKPIREASGSCCFDPHACQTAGTTRDTSTRSNIRLLLRNP